MKIFPLILTTAGLLAIACDAFAFGPPTFEEIDTDKDQKISIAEFVKGTPIFVPSKKIFKRLDANHDNFLDREEFARAKR